jgi:hypothetical protein
LKKRSEVDDGPAARSKLAAIMSPISMNSRLMWPARFAACLVAMLAGGLSARSADDPLAAAFARSDAGFRLVKERVSAVEDRLDKVSRMLATTSAGIEGRPDAEPSRRADALDHLGKARARLDRLGPGLVAFRQYADKTAQATDAVIELQELAKILHDEDVAALQSAAGATAELSGLDVAASQESVRLYGEALTGLLGTVDGLVGELETMRGQAQLRSETYGGAADPRYRQLAAQWGQDFADAKPFAPSSPWDVFRPTDNSVEVALIWNDREREWYRVDGRVAIEKVFRDAHLALGQRPTPGRLKYLAENFGQLKSLEAAAEVMVGYLSDVDRERLTPRGMALAAVRDSERLAAEPPSRAAFRAGFVYDPAFRGRVLDGIDKVRRELIGQGAQAKAALDELDAVAKQYGIALDSQWAQGVIPAVATVRVVAWFSGKPRNKFTSTWQFDKEKVTVDIANDRHTEGNGYAHGVRSGDVIRSEGSIPSRNCSVSDERTFKQGGHLTFSAAYTCRLDDGTVQTSNMIGSGTWQLVSPGPGRETDRSDQNNRN